MSLARGAVVAVSRSDAYTFTKPVHDEIVLVAGVGIEGDVHAGVHARHRGRMRADPGQPNLRQVHLIQAELFAEVAEKGYDVAPGNLGENVTTSGIDLLALPAGTILRFGPPATAAAGSPTPGGSVGEFAPGAPAGAGDQGVLFPVPASAAVAGAGPLAAVLSAAAAARLDRPTAVAAAAVRATAERVFAAEQAAAAAARTRSAVAASGTDDASSAARVRSAATSAEDAAAATTVADVVDGRAAIILAGLRNPCAQINGFRDGLLKEMLGRDSAGRVVRKSGVMGVVLRGGAVRPGDPVEVELPPPPFVPLERV